MNTLGQIGEHEAIKRLTAMLGNHSDLLVGAGDDCAVATLPHTGSDQVFTTDPVIEGVHFNPGEIPERIGNKAAGRVLSDIAAMGAQPQWMLVNVAAPPEMDFQRLEKIYAGMGALCARFGATIIGGDLAQGACLELHLFGTGLVPEGSALLRSGAKPGDAVFVSGPLGCSITGKHLDFVPRVEEGVFLRETGLVNAMMDVSDGLATDLRHMLKQSGVGAVLAAESIPKTGTLEQALYDGEDFELLFTASAENAETLQRQWERRFGRALPMIGKATAEAERLELKHGDGASVILESKAFEHFSRVDARN
ncbi:thiamine-phosphate kinase [Pontiella sulfatireligans]|uniref:Thiamine-monophosphate kinase n=1 Tax=Pontiella sulfatireligans TaxID=2750658 RepID=A0A6C2UJT0_9BACT|nr:thiamine-phosphate kinase [Pontiella sulfatireligans]VGO19671.1 Thiamine-monophosphate kinase [Pontiella sulfatireligans]